MAETHRDAEWHRQHPTGTWPEVVGPVEPVFPPTWVHAVVDPAAEVLWRNGWSRDYAERTAHRLADRVLVALVGRVQAAALRDYADREHALGAGGGPGPVSLPGGWVEPDSFCQCGASEGEDDRYQGCAERIALLRYADEIEPRTGEVAVNE